MAENTKIIHFRKMNLNQVTVTVKDIDASIAFYQKLGLKLIVKAPHYARFECPEGDSTFSIHTGDSTHLNSTTTVYFETETLDQKVAELLESGVQFDLLPTDQTWLWREARLKDLDNNPIILFYGGKNRLNPPWRLSG
jgi:catechol 2,3-dioxygenase-like lactoylglutathione lyase family enzyme